MAVILVGDAKEIRNVRGAVTDGAFAGLLIEKDLIVNANGILTKNISLI